MEFSKKQKKNIFSHNNRITCSKINLKYLKYFSPLKFLSCQILLTKRKSVLNMKEMTNVTYSFTAHKNIGYLDKCFATYTGILYNIHSMLRSKFILSFELFKRLDTALLL